MWTCAQNPSDARFCSPPRVQCYYIGATSDAATKIVNEVSKPLSHHVPVEKICEKLKKKDGQICELRYGEVLTGRDGSPGPTPPLWAGKR